MCLTINRKLTASVRKTLKEKGKISVWKYLRVQTDGLFSYVGFEWKPGENFSSRTQFEKIGLTANEKADKQVFEGFHFYLKRPRVQVHGYPLDNERLVRCIGKLEDFVAAGDDDDVVFAKAILFQSEYNKALKKEK